MSEAQKDLSDEWESEIVVVEINGVLDARTIRQAVAAKQITLRRPESDNPLLQDRLVKIVIITPERRIHFFSAYASQTACSDNVKNDFWALIDEKTAVVPSEDMFIIARDLNGHVGVMKDGYRCYADFGYGVRNDNGDRILDYAKSHNLVIVKTKFRKRPSHLVFSYDDSNKTQIDYVLVSYRDQKPVTDAKVEPYETLTSQHRPLICTMKITPPNQKCTDRSRRPE
ncbi:hypothetical protein Y032_0008g163 [Ancylostoma ceylanicum]|uniref:Endonuclease/exonuclease/phosphatase domain-containing protein n=1 Tax=Ancylostoma ceylanicum TaxID=53326 RepID=A0A016VKD6_9BILA|nr:hypothetical protein Y032_0008g163 [Ancylostoma ceylanicum]